MADQSYNTDVYREQGTGKVIPKDNAAIADVTESPGDAAANAAAINAILAALRVAGVIPSS